MDDEYAVDRYQDEMREWREIADERFSDDEP